jgi:hypothetical protein
MIKHIVMFRLKDFAEGKSKHENALWMKENLENLVKYIPELIHLEVGLNIVETERSWDLAIYSKFESKENLDIYMTHPKHIELVNHILKIREESHTVDYLF